MRRLALSPVTVALFIAGMFVLGMADFSIKQTSGKISPSLGTLLYAVTAVLPPLLWVLWTKFHEPLMLTRDGVWWSIATGISFGLLSCILFILFSQGVNLSIGTPVLRIGGIVLAATLGIIVLREGLNWQYMIGFAMAAAGIFLVATR